MDPYQKTFETWNKLASLYQEKFMQLDRYNDSYDVFCELVPKNGAPVFEIGCGPGNITRYLLSKRPDFKIHAIDTSPNMIELAKNNNPRAQFSVMDAREIGSLAMKFDGIISGFCMPYLSEEDNNVFVSNCSRLLNENGVLYLSAIKGNYKDSGFVKSSTGDECYIYYYDEDFLKRLLDESKLELVELNCRTLERDGVPSLIEMICIARKLSC